MKKFEWFDRQFTFGLPKEMLPFYLERLEGTIARIEQKVKGVDNKILSAKLNDKWSIKQNIGHLAEVDQVGNKRIDEMTSGVAVLSPAVFEPQDYNPWPIEKVVHFFIQTRRANLDKYKTLSEEQVVKSSLHPRLKVQLTPVDLAWFDAEHDDHHLVKINEIL
ncbi:MAG TPA: DinB family protein [Cyclobacteriaceae bacterium]